VPHPLRSLQRVGYATVGIEIRGIPPFAKSAKDGAPGAVALSISPNAMVGALPLLFRPTYPGFLLRLVALSNSVRLSFKKAAHADVSDALRNRKSGYAGANVGHPRYPARSGGLPYLRLAGGMIPFIRK
jgi:hypothetical protein